MIFESDCLLNVSVSDNLVKNYLQCCIDDSKVVLHTSDWDFVQEKSNGKNAKFPAARIVDGVVKSIIVEKVIHTKFMAYRDQRFISQVL